MFNRKMRLALSDDDVRIIVRALVDLKNDLIRQGRYTDAVDEILIRLLS